MNPFQKALEMNLIATSESGVLAWYTRHKPEILESLELAAQLQNLKNNGVTAVRLADGDAQ